MPGVTINGQRHEFTAGATVLEACRERGIEVPTLCHDDRLAPSGACRLCVVDVAGWPRPATACNTVLAEGMDIHTHSPHVEDLRRTLLELLARDYPAQAMARAPGKEFHRWCRHYGIPGANPGAAEARETASPMPPPFWDDSHPYLHADLSQCITCYRCVRICDEVQGQFVWRAFHRGDRTRIAPDSPTLLASDCVSCGACADTCPTGAIEDQSVLKHGEPTDWTRTTCPYCGTGCELRVGTRDHRLVQIKPVLTAPVSKGHLCVKGRYAFEFTHAADRVTDPMIRTNGSWRIVSWPEAFSFAARQLTRIVARHGPDAIGVLASARATNEENYLAQKFARVVLGTNNVDGCARVCHQPTATGMLWTLGTGAATNSFDDIERARAFLVCGCNPTENHPIVGARIKQAVRRGAPLILIDPRATELARYAEVHLAPRPGTNVPLLNAMAQVILEEKWEDEIALRERVDHLDEFRRHTAQWTAAKAAAVCGIEADQIRRAARVYATVKPAMCFHGSGITEHTQGTEAVMGLVNLALITGNVGKPGSGINPLRGQNNVQGSAHMGCEPRHLAGYVTLDDGRARFEKAWNTVLPQNPGLTMPQMIDAAERGRLKALWAIGYDIAHSNPNLAQTRRALESLEFVLVQDLFMNEIARDFGSVFLPACSSFEKDGTFMNSERRVQRVRQAMPPLGQSKADWQIICQFAQALGQDGPFAFSSAEAVWNEIRQVWPAGAGITYARLDQAGLQWPCPTEDHPGTALLHRDTFAIGPRAGLRSVDFHPTPEQPTAEYPLLLTTGRALYQFNAGTMTRRTANALLHATDFLDMSRADAARLGLAHDDIVRVCSRHGSATMRLRIADTIRAGQLFATFHSPEVMLNQLTSGYRDTHADTPEYKVVAVCVEKA